MNIFHKLDIHYPGTDIRAEARGCWLGEGAALSSLPLPLQPGVPGLRREPWPPSALCVRGCLSPIFPQPVR